MTEEDWERHYDTILWTITTIFAVAIGGLFSYVNSNPDFWLSIFGLILTGITIYLATSFRQLRHGYKKKKSPSHLSQWPVYILIFWGLGLLWIRLLANCFTESFWCIFIVITVLWSNYIIFMRIKYNKPKRTL